MEPTISSAMMATIILLVILCIIATIALWEFLAKSYSNVYAQQQATTTT